MAPSFALYRRDSSDSSVTVDLTIVLLVLLILSILSVGALWFLRRKHRAREASLLSTHGHADGTLATPAYKGHRRLSGISISKDASYASKKHSPPSFVDVEKQEFMSSTSPPPPVEKLPQICITFPEEVDKAGKRLSGRSVLIHVDDKGGIGMEPMQNEHLPPYESGRFVSLDLDRIGGLKEKN
ncbi:MAG: hypothetical protein Q9162_005383 [Coniocarpon cinnabarinum]